MNILDNVNFHLRLCLHKCLVYKEVPQLISMKLTCISFNSFVGSTSPNQKGRYFANEGQMCAQ